MTKRCGGCGIDKPLECFHRRSSCKDGRVSHCKDCKKTKAASDYVANRETINARNARWRAENPSAVMAYNAQYRSEHTTERRAYNRRYRQANAARLSAQAANRYQLNRDRMRAVQARWRAANPEKYGRNHAAVEARRRARQRGVAVAKFTAAQLAAKWAYWGNRCWLCGADAAETDHVKPLAQGGPHILANLRPICRSCNATKGSAWPYPTERCA